MKCSKKEIKEIIREMRKELFYKTFYALLCVLGFATILGGMYCSGADCVMCKYAGNLSMAILGMLVASLSFGLYLETGNEVSKK